MPFNRSVVRCRSVVFPCIAAILGLSAGAKAQFSYQAPTSYSTGSVNVWNDNHGSSGDAPIATYSIGAWQTVPWPQAPTCSGGLYSQQPQFSASDWQIVQMASRTPVYQITLGAGSGSGVNRLELNSSPNSPPPGTHDACIFVLEPPSTCSTPGQCIPEAWFKWSTYIPSEAAITAGLAPYDWGGDLFQLHFVESAAPYPSGGWPILSMELDQNGNAFFAMEVKCTPGADCIQLDSSDPSSTALNWKQPLSPSFVGRWIDFAFHIKLSTGAASDGQGIQELWVDGQKVASYTGANLYSSSSGHPRLNVQHGYYRKGVATSTSPVYQSEVLYTTTNPAASGAPVITAGPSSSPTDTTATITWTTDTPATSQINYGPTNGYGSSTTLDSTQVTSHSQAITGLTPSTTYHYQVVSSNSGGTTSSADATFTTLASGGTGSYSDAVWVKQLGTPADEYGWAVATDSSGNVFVAGYTTGALQGNNQGGQDVAVAKYSSAGVAQWTAQLGSAGDEHAYGAATDSAGNLYVAGSTTDAMWGAYAGGAHDAFVAKWSPGGSSLWSDPVGSAGDDLAYAIAVDGAGNIYVAGSTTGSFGATNAGGLDAWVAKYDPNMTALWVKQFGGAGDEIARGVAVDGSGNVYVAGSATGAFGGATYNGGLHDAFLVKLDSNGAVQWTKLRGTTGDDVAYAVALKGSNPVVCGSTTGSLAYTNSGGLDAWYGEYASTGSVVGERQLGSAGDDEAYGIAADPAGNVYITGSNTQSLTPNFRGGYDIFVARYDASRNRTWIKTLGSSGNEVGLAVAANASSVYVAGGTTGALGGVNQGGKDLILAQFAP